MKAGPATPFGQRLDMLAPVIERVFELDAVLRTSVGSALASLPPDHDVGEIGWGVIGSDVALVIAEDHAHEPIDRLLDRCHWRGISVYRYRRDGRSPLR
jgi:hypothetical protein